MRVIAGLAKGLTLKTPNGRDTRPMDGRCRQALFNILISRLAEARTLDLYAGSGSLGLEALSRGAASCVFVEKNGRTAAIIQDNLERSNLEGGEVMSQPSSLAVRSLSMRDGEFDLVFFDPPFPMSHTPEGREVLMRELAVVAEMLAETGMIVWRLERRNFFEEELPETLQLSDRRQYGRSLMVFVTRCVKVDDQRETVL
jgi:16S rRNA (guanine966-N2)-methyltransferase